MWQYASRIANGEPVPYHGDCTAPVTHEVRGAESIILSRLKQWADPASSVDYAEGWGHMGGFKPPKSCSAYISVRCRKCDACLNHRRRVWTARAVAEVDQAPRSWFVTLTFKPERRFVLECFGDQLARKRRAERLTDMGTLDRFTAISKPAAREVTKWLKRLRKVSGAKLRYLLVSEAHADGFPHYHLLIHEVSGTVTKRQIEQAWQRNGFSHCRLVDRGDSKATYYVCKYLNKSAQTRVRASLRYGQIHKDVLSEAIRLTAKAGKKIACQKEKEKRGRGGKPPSTLL